MNDSAIQVYYSILAKEEIMKNNSDYCQKWNWDVPMIFNPYLLVTVLFFIFLIDLVGIIGNILSFIIMSKGAKESKTRLYLSVLAIADLLSIIINCFITPIMLYLNSLKIYTNMQFSDVFYGMNDRGLCQMRLFLGFTFRLFSVSIISMFSIERAFVIYSPFTRCSLKYKRAVWALVLLFLYSMLMSLHTIFSFEVYTKDGRPICSPNKLFNYTNFIDLFGHQLIPLISIFISNILIIIKLRNRSKDSTLTINRKTSPDSLSQEMRITRRLLSVSIYFLFSSTPIIIGNIIRNYSTMKCNRLSKLPPHSNILLVTLTLFTTNFAVNFILYCFTGVTFWSQAKALLKFNYREFVNLTNASERPSMDDDKKAMLVKYQRDEEIKRYKKLNFEN